MGNCPSGELSSGELSSGELSEWGIVLDPYKMGSRSSRGARWSKWTPRAIFGCPVVF